MDSNISGTNKFSSKESEQFYLTVNQLCAQIGVFDSVVVEQCLKLRKEEAYYQLKEQIPIASTNDNDSNAQDSDRDKSMKGSEVLEWMANHLTRIMYAIYDIGLVLGTNTLSHTDSRIDKDEIEWLVKLCDAIRIPDSKHPVMPIGNQPATQCYVATTLCQQAIFYLKALTVDDEEQPTIYIEYLVNLEKLLILFARLSNSVLKDREWFWKPESDA